MKRLRIYDGWPRYIMKRFVTLTVGIFALLAMIFLVASSQGWTEGARYEVFLARVRMGRGAWLAAVLIGGLLAADLVLPVPSSVLMVLAGALLGPWRGMAVSLAGAMAGALLGFGLCRRFGRRMFERFVGPAETERVGHFMKRYGVWAVLLSRSVPMLTEAISCIAGLSRMRWSSFAGLVLAGTAPICGVYAWAGHRAGSLAGQGGAVLLAFALPAAGFALARYNAPRPMETASDPKNVSPATEDTP